jgi:hypothetical protein
MVLYHHHQGERAVRNIIIGAAVVLAIAAAIFVELCTYAEIASQAERGLKEGITEDERHGVDEARSLEAPPTAKRRDYNDHSGGN